METFVQIGADRLWVEDTGGEGPTVVLVHPGIHDATVWDPVLPLLDGFRAVRYDGRGFGRSPMPTESFRPVDDLLAVLDHAGIERAHLVGNSMGGEACLALVVERPERVASLTLLAPGINGYVWPDDSPELEAEFVEVKESGDDEAMVDFLGRIWCASGVTPEIRAQIARSQTADGALEALALDNPEQWSHVGRIAVPTAVVTGDIDLQSSRTAATDLAAAIPDAELVRMPGVDHLPSLRDPQTVADVVRRTVARTL